MNISESMKYSNIAILILRKSNSYHYNELLLCTKYHVSAFTHFTPFIIHGRRHYEEVARIQQKNCTKKFLTTWITTGCLPSAPGQADWPQGDQRQWKSWGTLCSWASSAISSSLTWTPFPMTPAGLLPQHQDSTMTNIQWMAGEGVHT